MLIILSPIHSTFNVLNPGSEYNPEKFYFHHSTIIYAIQKIIYLEIISFTLKNILFQQKQCNF